MKSAPFSPHAFNPLKPFYPLVMGHLAQLLGSRDLVIRGALGRGGYRRAISAAIAPLAEGLVAKGSADSEADVYSKLLGPLVLPCSIKSSATIIDPEAVAFDAAVRPLIGLSQNTRAASGLLVLAHEECKEQPFNDRGPLWEFLRHCRNGISHGGRFHLSPREPVRSAAWGPFTITKAIQGVPVFRDANGSGLLETGDSVRLLWDIEQAYPSIPARRPTP